MFWSAENNVFSKFGVKNIRVKNQLFSVDHMFALFFDSYWIFSWLFLDYFANPFSLLSATQILRADDSFSSALAPYQNPNL
jgi:hypothetical protein